jgi:hypothetical protein
MKRRSAESVDEFRQSLGFTGIENRLFTETVQPDDQTSSGLSLDVDLVKNSILQLAYWGESQFEPQPRKSSLFKRQKKLKNTTQSRSLLTDNQSSTDLENNASNHFFLQRNGTSRLCQQFPSILAMMSENKPEATQERRKSLKLRSPLTKTKGSFNVQLAPCKSAATVTSPDTRRPAGLCDVETGRSLEINVLYYNCRSSHKKTKESS